MFATTAICVFFWVGIVCLVIAILYGLIEYFYDKNFVATITTIVIFFACMFGFIVARSMHNNKMSNINKIANRYCIIDQKADSGFYDPEAGKIICQHEHSWPTIKMD